MFIQEFFWLNLIVIFVFAGHLLAFNWFPEGRLYGRYPKKWTDLRPSQQGSFLLKKITVYKKFIEFR